MGTCVGKETSTPANARAAIPAGCKDYKVEGGKLVPCNTTPGIWRLAGNTTVGYGFELTQDKPEKQTVSRSVPLYRSTLFSCYCVL